MPVVNVSAAEEYQKYINADKTTVALFAAEWAEQCGQVKDALEELAKITGEKLQFISLNAEQFPEISMKHQVRSYLFYENITVVPHSFAMPPDRGRAHSHILRQGLRR